MTNSRAPALSQAKGPALSGAEGLTDDDLLGIFRKEESAASNYQASALSQARQDALSHCDRKPYGDEQEGLTAVASITHRRTLVRIRYT
jgi:hypothetical protein